MREGTSPLLRWDGRLTPSHVVVTEDAPTARCCVPSDVSPENDGRLKLE